MSATLGSEIHSNFSRAFITQWISANHEPKLFISALAKCLVKPAIVTLWKRKQTEIAMGLNAAPTYQALAGFVLGGAEFNSTT